MRRWLLMFILMACAGCNGANVANPTPPVDAATAPPATASAARLLVWTGAGGAPGQGSLPGTLGLMDETGTLTSLLEIPARALRVTPCAVAPDARFFAFYAGRAEGAIYLMDGTATPVPIDENAQYLSCLDQGSVQFSPDGARFAYIDYEDGATTRGEYAEGNLKVLSLEAAPDEVARFDDVITFDYAASGLYSVSFFRNPRDEADEAAVTRWDGSGTREIVTLTPDGEGCRFTSARLAVVSDARALLMLGRRCTSGQIGTRWMLYNLDLTAGTAAQIASETQRGTFLPFARTNNLFYSNTSFALFAVPDGLSAYTTGLHALNLDDLSISTILEEHATMPTLQDGIFSLPPALSPDGAWLATVVTSPNAENRLFVFEMANPTASPIVVSAGARGDTISSLVFTPDSRRLLYVAGGDEGDDNTLMALDLAEASEARVGRGRFGPWLALSPDGGRAALLDWGRVEDPREPAYATLAVLTTDPTSSTTATLFTGADIVDGKVENLRFAVPLAWR